MSPRPRGHTDTEILEAAAHVVAKNPDRWTLRELGDFIGMSPATLVQRFGSKLRLECALIAYLNEKSGGIPILAYSDGDDRHAAGLHIYRLLAAISPSRELSQLAQGVSA